jgi:hypothetical protein
MSTADIAFTHQDVVAALPPDLRDRLPVNEHGQPQVEIVKALFKHEQIKPGEFRWTQIRELDDENWKRVLDAHGAVHRATRSFDSFLSFAWADLQNVREEVLRQLRSQSRPNEWMPPLVEYRILNFSAGLKMYHEHVDAEAARHGDQGLKDEVARSFSDIYDRSFGYRLLYSMRNAFLHGARRITTLHMIARVTGADQPGREPEVRVLLDKERFAAGKSNAAVRRQVREHDADIDLLDFSAEAFSEVEKLHRRLSPLLHPDAPVAAQLIGEHMREVGNERAHFHSYTRGFPFATLGTHTLDRLGFEYVVAQLGVEAVYEDGPPHGAAAAVARYPSND